MPRYDRTGPWGRGPRTGRGAGYCPSYGFGAETPSGVTYIESERGPTQQESSLWDRAQSHAKRVIALSYALKLQYKNLLLEHQFAKENGITLSEKEDLASMETRLLTAISQISTLKDVMCDVNQLELGVRLSSTGTDLDVIDPPTQTLGWIIPAVAGAVIVAGIIARWAYLENEVGDLSDKYNGVIRRADQALCADPTSQTCADWKATKQNGAYYQRETVIDKIKSAASYAGQKITTGIGAGIALLIPLLAFLYLPRKRGS